MGLSALLARVCRFHGRKKLMCLLHLELYCAMAGSAVRRARGHNGFGVESGHNIFFEKRADVVQLFERKLFELLPVFFAIQDEIAYDFVSLAERHPFFRQVIGDIRSSRKALLRRSKHGPLMELHGIDHAGYAIHAVMQRLGRVERSFLALLQIFVVCQRQRLHGHKKSHQVSDDTTHLSASQLREIGILLLWHNRRPR